MKTIEAEKNAQTFAALEEWFRTGTVPEDSDAVITEEGIVSWGNIIYVRNETYEEYLNRRGYTPNRKYTVSAYAFIQNGEWNARGDMGWFGISVNDKEKDIWSKTVTDYIDSIPDDGILVTVDCHI